MKIRILPYCFAVCFLVSCKSPAKQLAISELDIPPKKSEAAIVDQDKNAKMVITSNDVVQDEDNQTATFTGNVDMRHPDFRLRCDHLIIYTNEGTFEPGVPFKQAIATGARVVVERTLNNGVKELGESRKAVFDPQSGNIILSEGPPRLQSGKSLITTTSPGAIIILRKDGSHSVREGSGGAKLILGIPRNSKSLPLKD